MKKNNDIKIAGNLTINNWQELNDHLNSEKDENWGLAFHFFEERIKTRYLNPIHTILKMEDNLGEGFAVLNLQCSLIETIESFINGWVYHNDGIRKNLNGWFQNIVQDETHIKKIQNNLYIFESFFKNHLIFKKINGKHFYFNVRCSLLHETQTKNNWKIKLDKDNTGVNYEEKNDEKLIYRENFQKDLETLIKNYKKSIIDRTAMDGIPAFELRENFIAKFNHICKES